MLFFPRYKSIYTTYVHTDTSAYTIHIRQVILRTIHIRNSSLNTPVVVCNEPLDKRSQVYSLPKSTNLHTYFAKTSHTAIDCFLNHVNTLHIEIKATCSSDGVYFYKFVCLSYFFARIAQHKAKIII